MNQPKTILITGCASGVGYCAAQGLKARGYRVFATTRKAEDAARLTAEGFEAFQLDLADSNSIREAVERTLDATGGQLYGLFNNGAYGQPGAVEDLRREVLRAQFETNLFGTHELTNLVIPVMRRQGYGRIVQCSSVLGFVAMRWRGAYNATKYALEGLTDTLRLELTGSGVYVSLVEPGPIISQFRDSAFARYEQNIDPQASVHGDVYRAVEEQLQKLGPVAPFSVGPEVVLKRVIRALEDKHPKARYYVGVPTYLFGFLKRILPDSMLDKILIKLC